VAALPRPAPRAVPLKRLELPIATALERAGLSAVDVATGAEILSASVGLLGRYDHPDVVAGIERIVGTAKANGLSAGAGVGTSSLAAALIRHGRVDPAQRIRRLTMAAVRAAGRGSTGVDGGGMNGRRLIGPARPDHSGGRKYGATSS
jgi:hypothetical protein